MSGPDPAELTTRQSELLRFIVRHKEAHDGNSPTLRKIVDGTRYSSTSAVVYALNKLERYGHIVRGDGCAARDITVLNTDYVRKIRKDIGIDYWRRQAEMWRDLCHELQERNGKPDVEEMPCERCRELEGQVMALETELYSLRRRVAMLSNVI